jgi:hypothetical protein
MLFGAELVESVTRGTGAIEEPESIRAESQHGRQFLGLGGGG